MIGGSFGEIVQVEGEEEREREGGRESERERERKRERWGVRHIKLENQS